MDNLAVTPGSGALVASDDVGGVQYQRVKLDGGADGASAPILGDSANGLRVDVTRVQGGVAVHDGGNAVSVDDNGASLTVDAAMNAPVFVRLSDGTNPIAALPVTDNGASFTVDAPASAPVFVRLSDGTNPVAPAREAQLPAALVGGRLDVNIGASGASVAVNDGAGSLTVDGSVAAAQGAPAAVGGAWPVKLTDGASVVGITDVSGAKALKVDVVAQTGSGVQADKSAFTEGTGILQVAGAVVNDTISADPAEDQAAALRLTPKRGLHANLRNQAGTEIGTAGAPVRTDPTGTTTQPVLGTHDLAIKTAVELIDDAVATTGAATPAKGLLAAGTDGTNARALAVETDGRMKVSDGGSSLTVDGTVAATQSGAWTADVTKIGGSNIATAASGIPKVGLTDEAGAAFSETNPLPVRAAYPEHTVWRSAKTYGASESDIAIFTPTGGKRFVVCGLIITPTAAGALLKIFDGTNAAGNMIYQGQPPLGSIVIQFAMPFPAAAVNNVLRYSTGGSAAGDLTAWGYEV